MESQSIAPPLQDSIQNNFGQDSDGNAQLAYKVGDKHTSSGNSSGYHRHLRVISPPNESLEISADSADSWRRFWRLMRRASDGGLQ